MVRWGVGRSPRYRTRLESKSSKDRQGFMGKVQVMGLSDWKITERD